MAREITSKNIDGITDLVVIAPIKEGFIHAYENITYTTRLKLVAEALNRVRVTAREHERITPFSDVTERILTLLDFRVGIIDKDLFSLRVAEKDAKKQPAEARKMELESRRYLYLTATFDGAWEPYMRLIWHPLGPFLDLLFCNCEGYVTATDHSFDEYAQWVRDNQMDSAIFYATTGLTIRDHLHLSQLEKMQRSGQSDLALAEAVMAYPEDKAAKTRRDHLPKAVELGLEALTVLYKLADYYPPQWLTGTGGGLVGLNEGQRLVRVARDLLRGWDDLANWLDGKTGLPVQPTPDQQARWLGARAVYAEPLHWYETGRAELSRTTATQVAARAPDPEFHASEIQSGILDKQGSADAPVRQGALLLFTIRDTVAARRFVKDAPVRYEAGPDAGSSGGLFRNIGFTPEGLLRLGVDREVVKRFPKEFQEGMAARSGLFGDMRENHPRNWILPERNGPALLGVVPVGTRLPPVEPSEIDFVVQIRSSASDRAVLEDEVKRLAGLASAGASLQAVEWLESSYDPQTGLSRDQFGFIDGVSQPKPRRPDLTLAPDRDAVALGEVLLGYGNDRGDARPDVFAEADRGDKAWRERHRTKAAALQKNGSFLVVRKIGQEADAFDTWARAESNTINKSHPDLVTAMTPDRLKARVLGRNVDGTPLILAASGPNDFDFSGDAEGHACPLASHIRRANPRKTNKSRTATAASRIEFERPTPRILRRGMRFDQVDSAGRPQRGLMFMCYNASIAEQYETIQRWLNGGNSTDIASAHNDPLTGVQPKDGPGVFRFIEPGKAGPEVVRAFLPAIRPGPPPTRTSVPGRHPFTPLHWGIYLFVPSRTALRSLTAEQGEYRILEDPLEIYEGQPILDRLDALGNEEAAKEWKRLLEDFDTKDPAQRDLSPSMWGLIRLKFGGAKNLRRTVPSTTPEIFAPFDRAGTIKSNPPIDQTESEGKEYDWETGPDFDEQNVILVAGRTQVRQVLADWKNFTVEEQLRRIEPNSGPIFVTQQPDNDYRNTRLQNNNLDYSAESTATNAILLSYGEDAGFAAGYAVGVEVLNARKQGAARSALSVAMEDKKRVEAEATAAIAAGADPAVENAKAKAIADAALEGARHPSFKLELRREYLLPALGGLCQRWYGLPDNKHMLAKGWSWDRIVEEADAQTDAEGNTLTRSKAHCPGDFLSPSRNAFYPRPSKAVAAFAGSHGNAILAAAEAFVTEHRASPTLPLGSVAEKMFATIPDTKPGNAVLARNLIGTMVGAIPPMDGNLRGILLEWLGEKSLWRHQAALRAALKGQPADSDFTKARDVLYRPIAQAMCKRPAPDLLYRTAKGETDILLGRSGAANRKKITTRRGDLIVVSLVAASQRSLLPIQGNDGEGDVSIVFGGRRKAAAQGYRLEPGQDGQESQAAPDPESDDRFPVHACPAQDMAMGAIMGIMAALLDVGTIQALPASLIVKISDWT